MIAKSSEDSKTLFPIKVDLDAEKKIQAEVYKNRIRVTEFFRDFDKLRKGYVSEAAVIFFAYQQFKASITGLHISLSDYELNQILNKYRTDEGMIDYKHTKLKIAYPSLDLTLFSAVNTCFTQSSIREEIEPMAIEPIAAEDDQWLSKLNNEKEDEEFSLLGALGTQDSIQAYDVTSNNDLDYIDYRRLQIVRT